MKSLKEQFVAKGIVSRKYVNKMEQTEKEIKARGELLKKKRIEMEKKKDKAINLLKVQLPLAGIRPVNLEGRMHLGGIVQNIIKDPAVGAYRNHKCCVCQKEGTSRIESCRAHGEVMTEAKSFKFLIDDEEARKFAQTVLDKIGILLDEVDKTPLWICIPCKGKVIEKSQPWSDKYMKIVEPYLIASLSGN